MKFKASHLPYFALGAGAASLLVRMWLLTEGQESGGLLSVTHPGNALSYVLWVLVPLILLLAVLPLKKKGETHVYFTTGVTACAGCFAAAAGLLYTCVSQLGSAEGMIALVSCILGIVAAGCFALSGIQRLKSGKPSGYLHAVVTVYFMFHILSMYRSWNIEPQLMRYLPQLLALAFLMITAFQRTALDMDAGKVSDYLFFNYGALFFSVVVIAGENPVFYLSMALWTLLAGRPAKIESEKPMVLPANVLQCIHRLEMKGFTAYVVGGCVRDHLLGLLPHDYDLCTNARPEQICEVFKDCRLVLSGEKHGTVGVVIDGEVYEITTYRTEGSYSDNRHPDAVRFVDNIREDLARRDFTVNAMAFAPRCGYVDPFGGRGDLKNKCLRAVGDADTRFREDSLRILRGVRFALRFGLTPEEKTLQAMFDCAPLMDNLAAERIFTELCGLLPCVKTAEELMRYSPVITRVIPELEACVGFAQNNPHHDFDVFTHIAHAVAAVPQKPALRLAALLHDVGKPQCYTEDENGCGHFYGHADIGARMAETVLTRLKAPNALREQVVFLVERHMDLFKEDRKLMRRKLGKWGPEGVKQLMSLQMADLKATGKPGEEVEAIYAPIEQLLETILREESCFSLKDLAIGGGDLLELGMAPGPAMGSCLEYLLEQVLEEVLPNERETLLHGAKAFMEANP